MGYLVSSSYFEIVNHSATAVINGNNIYQPFLGGFNKPKIQWVDWNNDQIEDLFILDEDGSIRHYKNNESSDYELINNKFLGISNISWFYIADFDLDDEFEIITQDAENINQMVMFDIINTELVERGTVYDNTSYPVESDGVMTPTFCDIDSDGDLYFFTGNMIGTINFYENIGFENNAVHASKSPPIRAKYIPCHIAGPTLSGREAPIYWAMKVLT